MVKTLAINKKSEMKMNVEFSDLLKGDFLWFWVDFDQPSNEEVEYLRKPFKFHPLAIEDCIHTLQRPKLDYYEDHVFFVAQALNPHNFTKEEVDIFLGEKFIVTYHNEKSEAIDKVWKRLEHCSNVESWNPSLVLYEVLDKIVDNYFPLVQGIEESLNEIDENPHNKTMELLLKDLFDARHNLLSLRQVISPMQDLGYRILNSQRLTLLHLKKEYFTDIYDHLVRLGEMIEANRELTTDIRDSYIALNSTQTNHVMKVLTVITTIFMPLTFIAGVYGMNFEHMPELTWDYGYFEALSLMFLIGMGMFIWFKKKGWFK
ncbi:magnesium and cobalt transport protein CorA [Peribacillus saganii]|uniref:Magnesium transport protein CorA n=1 Tax=Peribacillus saganii TaxID=2303992 RepID=A0A372LPQ6_9BACI|nr:magnesium/cobalt transporter CorA [Peribacillus saganii]RFU69714.1 magnesium and cobalt transport protein CorA [Peribacillus saganii]